MVERLAFVLILALGFFGCDSFFALDSDVSGRHFDRVQVVRSWYESARSQPQPVLPGGKNTNIDDSTQAAVLAAMVRQYPPDWDKAVMWPNGGGG